MKNDRRSWCIGIPTINRADLLAEAMSRYAVTFPQRMILIMDNGKQDIDCGGHRRTIVARNVANRGVAGSWNDLADATIGLDDLGGHDAIVILNDDVILGSSDEEIDSLVHCMMHERSDVRSTVCDMPICSHGGMCGFVLSKRVREKVGRFDESFHPAYFEDDDYKYRMKLLGLTVGSPEQLWLQTFRKSSTISKDPSLNEQYSSNEEVYRSKWGGLPGQEQFLVPYNR
jgi:GT2 family glycosyltransferase